MMKLHVLLLLGLVALVAAQNAGLSRSVTAGEKADWASVAKAAQNSDGSFDSVKEAFFAVSTLKNVGANVPKKGDVCKQANDVLSGSDTNLENVFYAVEVAGSLGCLKPASTAVATAIITAIESETTATPLCHAILSGVALKDNRLLSKLDTKSLESSLDTLAELFDSEISVTDAGLAFQAAAAIATSSGSLSSEAQEAVELLSELIMDTLSSGVELDDGSVYFSDSDVAPLTTTAILLRGVYALNAAHASDLPSDLGSSVGEWVLAQSSAGSLEAAFGASTAVAAIANSSSAPLAVISHAKSISALGKTGNVEVSVSDIWGEPVSGATVYLLSASLNGKNVIVNQEMREVDGKFTLNILAAKPVPGHYVLKLTASSTSPALASVEEAIRVVRISLPVKVSAVTFEVKDPQYDDTVMTVTGSSKASFEAAVFHDVHASFTVKGDGSSSKPVTVQQAFLVFTSVEGAVEAVIPARTDGKSYSAKISMLKDGAAFQFHSGRYRVRLFVADAFVENAISKDLGEAKLKFPPGLEGKAKHHTVYEAKQNIEHQFRPRESRPPQSFSWMFTLIVLSPIAFLVIGILTAFPNISIPTSMVGFVSTIGFLSCIGLAGLVFWMYWIQWNLFQAAKALAAVMFLGTIFGKYALRARQCSRKAKKD